jgi:hypothetical protein
MPNYVAIFNIELKIDPFALTRHLVKVCEKVRCVSDDSCLFTYKLETENPIHDSEIENFRGYGVQIRELP